MLAFHRLVALAIFSVAPLLDAQRVALADEQTGAAAPAPDKSGYTLLEFEPGGRHAINY